MARNKSVVIIISFVAIILLQVSSIVSLTTWPLPSSISQGTGRISIDPDTFQITTSSSSKILQLGIDRYLTKGLIFPFSDTVTPTQTTLLSLSVTVNSDNESLQLGVDESYSLTINSGSTTATLQANTVYGALRGLETFSQLVDYSDADNNYAINCVPTIISDSPRFSWRGLLVDTARHYLEPSTLFRTIDALSYSKFNTLHWHAVDAESFPMVCESYPLLSEKGSYAPKAIYTPEMIKAVVEYGQSRGIRVVPEFDVPGHAYSWGFGYPNLTVSCPSYEHNINNIPLNPTYDFTYDVLTAVIADMSKLFIDYHFHVGGDEIVTSCWKDNDEVVQWMADHNFSTTQTIQYFEDNLYTSLILSNKTGVVWEDLFDNGVTVSPSFIIEVWKDPSSVQAIAKAGYKVITAYGNYLNSQTPIPYEYVGQWGDTWEIFYQNDPLDNTNLSAQEQQLVLGGEAAMWGEQVDSVNFDSRVWPRACAVSERLWSPATVTDLTDATNRLIEHRCRLARRGIGAGPIAPDFCSLPYKPYPYY